MADYYAATFARANDASAAAEALERAGIPRMSLSYATPALLQPGEQEGALEGLRRIFHPEVGLTGELIHLGFPEEAARQFTAEVEDGATLLVVVPGDRGRAVERALEQCQALRLTQIDAAGFNDVFITRRGGPLGPKTPAAQEDTHNPEAAHAYNTLEGEEMGDTTNHLGGRG